MPARNNNYLHNIIRLILGGVDLIILNLTFWLVFKYGEHTRGVYEIFYRHYQLVFNLIWILSAGYFNLYKESTIGTTQSPYIITAKSLALLLLLFSFYLIFTDNTKVFKFFLLLEFSFLSLSFMMVRVIVSIIKNKIKDRINKRRSVAILGKNQTGKQLENFFYDNNDKFSFEGFLTNKDTFTNNRGELLPEVTNAIDNAKNRGIKEIYVPLTMGLLEAGNLLRYAEKQCIRLKFVPICFDKSVYSHLNVNYMGDFQIISLRKEPLEDIDNRFRKRAFDILFSLSVIVCLLSWLYPILALIIKLQSKGPVLFKQQRSGINNSTFSCYKFRTMYVNDHSDFVQATRGDKRITPFGKFMRKTNLDELPQFLNVLMGDMSVVGPRPHMLIHTEKYSTIINQFMVRHFMKPGITGWAQVCGFRGETKKDIQMRKRVEHDIWYLGNWSSTLDLKIIFLTAVNMFKGEKNAF